MAFAVSAIPGVVGDDGPLFLGDLDLPKDFRGLKRILQGSPDFFLIIVILVSRCHTGGDGVTAFKIQLVAAPPSGSNGIILVVAQGGWWCARAESIVVVVILPSIDWFGHGRISSWSSEAGGLLWL